MRARPPRLKSLQARLLAWLLLSLGILVAVTSWFAYREALRAADTAYDRSLLAVARVIAERVELSGGRVTVEVPYVALDFFQADLRGRVFYRVSGLRGEFVSGFDDLPPLPAGIARSEDYFALARFYDTAYRGEPVRVVALHQPVFDERDRGMALIEVAETRVSREGITGRLLRGTLLRDLLLVLLAAAVIVIGVRVALRPVKRLHAELQAREGTDLSPLEAGTLPAEIRPVVEGMNDYMRRLREVLDAQERFIADASHQLRTPLTLLRTQSEMALREGDPARMRETVEAIHRSTTEMTHLANQLLGRARAHHGIGNPNFEEVDLGKVARNVCLDLAPSAVARSIDLEFDAPGGGVLRGDVVLLQELLRNLVDNAIRYSGEEGRVTVRVLAAAGAVVLEVEDSGSGIAPADRERVFDPFFRARAGGTGVGLGLTIARDIARAHQARIELADAREGTGLLVRVSFSRSRG